MTTISKIKDDVFHTLVDTVPKEYKHRPSVTNRYHARIYYI